MPSVKRRASKILNEYGAAQSELIGKGVVLTDGKAGTVKTFGWMNCTAFGFPSKVMMENGRSQPSSLRSPRPRIGCALPLLKHSNQNEEPDLGQESDAHDRDRKEHVARRERVHECLAPSRTPRVNHSGAKMFQFQTRAVRDASGASASDVA
jgi:hypothetical protein